MLSPKATAAQIEAKSEKKPLSPKVDRGSKPLELHEEHHELQNMTPLESHHEVHHEHFVVPANQEANPGPLGVVSFSTCAFALSVCNTGLHTSSAIKYVISMAIFQGGLIQLLAGMWELHIGHLFAGTVFSSYAAFWICFGFFQIHLAEHVPEEEHGAAAGLFLLSWTFASVIFLVASYRTNLTLFLMMILLETTLILLTIGNYHDIPGVKKAGGWTGLLVAFAGFYYGMAEFVNGVWKTEFFPIDSVYFRRLKGPESLCRK